MRQNTQNGTYITIRILKLKKNTLHNNKKYIIIQIEIHNKIGVKDVLVYKETKSPSVPKSMSPT
jgi:hypothetical protein